MADFNKPTLADLYSNVIQYIKDRATDIAAMFDSRRTAATNVPTYAKRWNDTAKRFEYWDGAAWQVLASTYGMNVDQLDGYHANTGTTASTIPVRDANGKVPGSITGDADTVDGCHAGVAANNVLKLDASAMVPLAQIPATLTGKNADQLDGYHAGNASGQVPVSNGTVNVNLNADKVDGYNASTSATASTIPVRDANGKVPGSITGDADTLDSYHANTGTTASTIPVRDASGKVPGSITGGADTLDGYHANTGTTASTIPVRDASGKVPGSITGDANTLDGYHASTSATASTVPVRDASGDVPGNVTGNAAYATSAGDADTLDGQHASAFAAAATVFLNLQGAYIKGTSLNSTTWNSNGRPGIVDLESTHRRSGTYGITYLDAYSNYANYANYSDWGSA